MDAYLIQGQVRSYAWGDTTSIARYTTLAPTGESMAEYWMGAHPDFPSLIAGTNQSLFELVKSNPKLLGTHQELPFLFKILAIAEPLAIQCHPTKKQAEAGWLEETTKRKTVDHELWNYKDQNQKAELLFALSEMVALYGFRPLPVIRKNISSLTPSFVSLFEECETIAGYFHTLYHLDEKFLLPMIQELRSNLDLSTIEGSIAFDAIKRYEKDPAVFAPYFMNVLTLKPGQGIFVPPQEIHAYVSGVGLELMNNSDNVLRAGLTKRPSDIAEFEKIMYAKESEPHLLQGVDEGIITTYQVPNREFVLQSVKSGSTTMTVNEPTILFALEGGGTLSKGSEQISIHQGQAWFLGSTLKECTLRCNGLLFMASV